MLGKFVLDWWMTVCEISSVEKIIDVPLSLSPLASAIGVSLARFFQR